LQFSDFHGALEASATSMGAAVMASSFAAERVKNPTTITVSSGDNIGAAPQISSAFEEIPTIEAMNLMKVDASVFGNHEHDRNVAHLAKVIGASEFQWVASNYSTLSGLESGTKVAKEYTIIERGGLKIGIVGYNTSQTKEQVFPGNLMTPSGKEIVIDPSVETVNKAIKAAKAAGADFVVALVHEGWTENLEGKAEGPLPSIAKEIQGAAIVYGGHSHLSYSSSNAGTVRTAPTLVAQVVNSGSEYTRSAVCFDTSRAKVLGSSVEYVKKADVATVAADATAAAMVKKYKDQLSPKLDVKVGSVSDQFPRGGTPAVERSGENPTGNYTTDVIRAKYKVDFVLTNGGGIRDTLPAKTYTPADKTLKRPATGSTGPYDVTLGDALTVYPFGNSVSTTTITGAGLWKALENGVSNFPTDGRFPQISGFKFSWDSTKAKMSRVVSVTTLDGKAIAADSKEYTIATLDFLVQGGDGYAGTFAPSKSKVRDLLVDVLIDALKADMAAGKVTKMPAADGRIVKVA
jgi:5'-nucleotidase